mmetsp:Transcript_16096/g.22479  ORF Transcript_16096/g.22479 Transcript_16096/m.22479 type:complete len:234 (-) Transcript_16096:96-797(-)
MPTTSVTAEQKELKRNVRELFTKRIAQQRDFDELQKFCEKSKTADGRGLVKRYLKGLKDASEEMTLAQTCLEGLLRYVKARVDRVQRENADIWSHAGKRVLPAGSKVAANTSENLWVLARIDQYMAARQRYHVVDDDEKQDVETRKRYKLEASKIIPLPSLGEYPITHRKIFRPGERVFAVYPNTTAFYKARVVTQPNKKDADPKYQLLFEDDGTTMTVVSVTNVVPIPVPKS